MKKLFKFIICILLVIALSGCGNKDALNKDTFYTELTNLGFGVMDVTSQIEDKNIKTIYTANNGKYQFEFYIFDKKENALAAYKSNRDYLKQKKGKEKEIEKENYNKFTFTIDNEYSVVVRNDNTLIFASINEEFKNDIEKVLSKIGY